MGLGEVLTVAVIAVGDVGEVWGGGGWFVGCAGVEKLYGAAGPEDVVGKELCGMGLVRG